MEAGAAKFAPLSLSFAPWVILGKWLLLVRGADHNKQERTEIPVTEPPSPCRQRARSSPSPAQRHNGLSAVQSGLVAVEIITANFY